MGVGEVGACLDRLVFYSAHLLGLLTRVGARLVGARCLDHVSVGRRLLGSKGDFGDSVAVWSAELTRSEVLGVKNDLGKG